MATWAQRRRWIIISIAVVVALVVVGIVVALSLYRAPMCTDGKQNGKEEGVDCGGPCPYLCSVDLAPPSVRFVRAVFPQPGRTDVIAYVDNSNQNAGVMHAKYTLELLDANGATITKKTGTVNLPPASTAGVSTAPVYIAHAYDGSQTVTQAFLTLDPQSLVWPRIYNKPVVPTTSSITIQNGESASPKVTAVLNNPTAYPLYGVTMVATIFDANNNAIASSQTFVTTLPAQGTAPLVFTWNSAFSAAPVRVEILLATGS